MVNIELSKVIIFKQRTVGNINRSHPLDADIVLTVTDSINYYFNLSWLIQIPEYIRSQILIFKILAQVVDIFILYSTYIWRFFPNVINFINIHQNTVSIF